MWPDWCYFCRSLDAAASSSSFLPVLLRFCHDASSGSPHEPPWAPLRDSSEPPNQNTHKWEDSGLNMPVHVFSKSTFQSQFYTMWCHIICLQLYLVHSTEHLCRVGDSLHCPPKYVQRQLQLLQDGAAFAVQAEDLQHLRTHGSYLLRHHIKLTIASQSKDTEIKLEFW